MKVICVDGTCISCNKFRAIDGGVLLFADEPTDESGADEDEEREASGFVPYEELRYVLPEGVPFNSPVSESEPTGTQSPEQPMAPAQEFPQQGSPQQVPQGQGASSGRSQPPQGPPQQPPPGQRSEFGP